MSDSACNVCGTHRADPLFVKNGSLVVRCIECGLVYANPAASGPNLAELYRDPAYFGGSGYYLDYLGHEENHRRLARRIVEAVAGDRPAGSWLDVGCAAGFLLDEARRRGFGVRGVELSPSMTDHARRLGIDVSLGTIHDAGLPAERFDVVSYCDSLEHVTDPARELREAHRVLGPGGQLAILTPNVESLLARTLGRFWPHFTPPEHVVYFSRSSLCRLLAKTGFTVRSAESLGHWFSIGEVAAKLVPPLRPIASRLRPTIYLDVGDLFVIAVKAV